MKVLHGVYVVLLSKVLHQWAARDDVLLRLHFSAGAPPLFHRQPAASSTVPPPGLDGKGVGGHAEPGEGLPPLFGDVVLHRVDGRRREIRVGRFSIRHTSRAC